MFKSILLKIVLTAGVFYIAGCSASTSSIRFEEKKEEQKNDKAVRFNNFDTTQFLSDDPSFDELSSDTDFDDEPGNIQQIDLTNLYNDKSENNYFSSASTLQENLIMGIVRYLKTPYKFGGNSFKGIDCSALTQNIYKDVLHFDLPRTAREQFKEGVEVLRDELQFGDLVFFNTRRRVRPGHVGIYIGDNLFAHASRSNGVTVTLLTEDYYSKRFMGARRVIVDWKTSQ